MDNRIEWWLFLSVLIESLWWSYGPWLPFAARHGVTLTIEQQLRR